MKPDWNDAPEWAQWLAMDENGDWYWFEHKPFSNDYQWLRDKGFFRKASINTPKWDETLEARPK